MSEGTDSGILLSALTQLKSHSSKNWNAYSNRDVCQVIVEGRFYLQKKEARPRICWINITSSLEWGREEGVDCNTTTRQMIWRKLYVVHLKVPWTQSVAGSNHFLGLLSKITDKVEATEEHIKMINGLPLSVTNRSDWGSRNDCLKRGKNMNEANPGEL